MDNGDTKRQLLARSRYLLFKPKSKWTISQITRAELLFNLYPNILKAYELSQGLSYVFENNNDKNVARLKLAQWSIEKAGFLFQSGRKLNFNKRKAKHCETHDKRFK